MLIDETKIYIMNISYNNKLSCEKGKCTQKMVKTNKYIMYSLICLLVVLTLILHVEITTIKKLFFIIK